MSAPSTRGQRGGSSTRGGRASSLSTTRGRGSARGSSKPALSTRGRGRGGSHTSAAVSSGDGLLQKLRAGTVKRGSENRTATAGRGRDAASPVPSTPSSRGRGRGFANRSQTFNTPRSQSSAPNSRPSSPAPTPAPANHRDFMNTVEAKYRVLKQNRVEERATAIRDGFLADPQKKLSLDKAITPVGTCTDMCPEFERVERIVQNLVDKVEKVHNEDTGRDIPAEDRMVKRFRRSAAGDDEQLPSDIRTPATLKRTLDYLLDKVIGGDERLATIHKFVWDRTRSIRNDFSIQQVTNVQDVKVAVDCYERIARFHILSLHQLSNPDNLWEGENFDAHQEREQLNNTLLSLLYYYDDHRGRIDFSNEGEFRAYCIIFELQSQHPDLEDRIQAWPSNLLGDRRVQTALKLYTAAGNSLFDQGPLRPMEPFAIAQSNTGSFWNILSSNAVPYIMACVAEIYFGHVRFQALDALWRSCKSAPAAQQAKSKDWSLGDVTSFLAFDSEEETAHFCAAFDLYFGPDENGEEHLDVTANSAHSLDQSSIPNQQSFSHSYVEKKRYRRTLASVINGVSVAEAIRQGWVVPEGEQESAEAEYTEDDHSMFIPETRQNTTSASFSSFGTSLNPQASPFTPKFGDSLASIKPKEEGSTFGQPGAFGGPSFGRFVSPAAVNPAVSSASTFGNSAPQQQQGTGFGFGGFSSPATPSTSIFGKPATSPQPPDPPFKFGQPTSTPRESDSNSQPDKAASPAPAEQPSFTGFNFGKPAPVSSTIPTTTPSAFTSTASSVPPIFGPRPSAQPLLSAKSAPSEETKTKSTSSTTSFQFPSFTQPSSQSLHPPPSSTRSQAPENRPTFAPSALTQSPTSTCKAQVPQPSSLSNQPKSAETPQPQPSLAPPATGVVFQPLPNTSTTSTTTFSLAASSDTDPKSNPSFEGFRFPAIQTPESASRGQAQPGQTPSQPDPATGPAVVPGQAVSVPNQRSTTPPHSPVRQPSKPDLTKADQERLAENVARIALVQPKGLLTSYLDFTLQDLLTTAVNQHRLEIRDAAIASVRQRVLARKFGHLWRSRAWTSSLNRRAKNRRQLFAETMRAEQARKQRSEEELEEILRATRETRRLQKEVQQAEKVLEVKPTAQESHAIGNIAGQKRKSFSSQNPPANSASAHGAPSTSGHKRSKTMGSFSEPTMSVRKLVPPPPNVRVPTSQPQHTSIFARASILGRSTGISDLRRSTSAQKLDTTRTEYFRLKAMGVDPDTPIIPDTKESLAIRRRKEAQERQASIDRAKRHGRNSVLTQSPPPPSPAQAGLPEGTPRKQANPHRVEDDFLKQIREAREAMAEQTDWFKQQSLTLEQEIEQEGEFRKSQSSHDRESTPLRNGMIRVNGYEYVRGETQSGLSLSRTERRIRSTGAHGLATKSVQASSDYVPVAMSKRSALNYTAGMDLSSPGRKRSHDDVESPISAQTQSQTNAGMHASKRPRPVSNRSAMQEVVHEKPRLISHKGGRHPYQLLQSMSHDDEEEEEEEEDDDDDDEDEDDQTEELYDEDEPSGQYQQYYGHNGAYAYDEEDEQGEEELEEEGEEEIEDKPYEDEEEDLDDEDQKYEYPPYLQQHQDEFDEAPTPLTNPQFSRAASSAPGGSADDAVVLSDSD